MATIEVRDLKKIYKVHQKPHGLGASVRALFHRQYKHVHAVDGITFDINAGEMVGFLGPNGAGKTTTLKILSGLIFPTEGEARVLGFIPWERRNKYRRQFALLMGQKNQLWWDLPAGESFRLHKEIYDIDDQRFLDVQGELTELLDVKDLLNQPVRELSLGERMKMELIAALLHSPSVLFLDEPTIGLDVVSQANIRKCLREYNQQRNVTIVLTSHYMKDIEALCDRVLMINHGRLMYDGPLDEIEGSAGRYKILTLRFANGNMPADLASFGEVVQLDPPKATLKLPRESVASQSARLLRDFELADLTVEDPPIEEIIAEMFGRSTNVESE